MESISLYRGNLHKIPDQKPRQWHLPPRRITIQVFRNLLRRRQSSLSNPDPPGARGAPALQPPSPPKKDEVALLERLHLRDEERGCDDVEMVEVRVDDGGDSRPLDQTVPLVVKGKEILAPPAVDGQITASQHQIPPSQGNDKPEVDEAKEKRKAEIVERLHHLKEKKHLLVQALKMIGNAEDELKRRESVQANQPPLPLQVDASIDSGSMTQHATPRTGSDANAAVDMETCEGNDAVNHNPQSGQLLRMSSTSPSAESALRRPAQFQHNVASFQFQAAGSPRFTPTGNQVQSSNLPTVSVTGTNYVVSSPSPAASVGTSVFRDARPPSPRK